MFILCLCVYAKEETYSKHQACIEREYEREKEKEGEANAECSGVVMVQMALQQQQL